MAAQFPSNTDKGKKYPLPSDIFRNDAIPSKYTPRQHLDEQRLQLLRRQQLSDIDDLAYNFTSLSLLPRRTLPKPHAQIPRSFELFKPPVRTGPEKLQLRPGYVSVKANVGRECELALGQKLLKYGNGSYDSSGSKPDYDPRLEPYLGERANMVLLGKPMQNRLLRQKNRSLPFLGSGFGLKGGFAREAVGTGVFHPHPRIKTSDTAPTAALAKKQSVRNRLDIQATQPRKSTKRLVSEGTSKQNHNLLPQPQDRSLPKEWTY